MQLRSLFFAATFLLLAACGNKYAYAPQFVAPGPLFERSIPAPPPEGSPAYQAGLEQVIAEQQRLTKADRDAMRFEDHIRPEVIVQPILGDAVRDENHPALYLLLKHAASDAYRVRESVAAYWHSPRPWYADARVVSHVEPLRAFGYPSGHTTTFGVWAYILADLDPAHAPHYFDLAWRVAHHRVQAGAHFPFDVEGGKQLAAQIYRAMQGVPQFQKEFAAAKAELAQ